MERKERRAACKDMQPEKKTRKDVHAERTGDVSGNFRSADQTWKKNESNKRQPQAALQDPHVRIKKIVDTD